MYAPKNCSMQFKSFTLNNIDSPNTLPKLLLKDRNNEPERGE
jgi:hypothetical protein